MKWHTAKNKVVGTSHIKADKPCQDAYFVSISKEVLIIAVSDGMGSAAYSDKGSALAARQSVLSVQREINTTTKRRFSFELLGQVIKRRLSSTPSRVVDDTERIRAAMGAAFETTHTALTEYAHRLGRLPRDYACTLLLVVVTKSAWYTMHVGDGAIVGYLTDDTTITLSEPENGEYVNTTTPLTSSKYHESMRFGTGTEALVGVALLTDGIQQLCINQKTRRSFDPFFAYVLKTFRVPTSANARDLLVQDFLCSQPVREKCDDDLTLVVAWRGTSTHKKAE